VAAVIMVPPRTKACTVSMSDKDEKVIQCRPRYNTLVLLEPNELIAFGVGDKGAGRRSIVSGSDAVRTDIVHIKPWITGNDAESNMNIVTVSGRSFTFRLLSCAKCVTDSKVFVKYLDPAATEAAMMDKRMEVIATLTARVNAAETAGDAAVKTATTAKQEADEKIKRAIAEFKRTYSFSVRTEYAYTPRNRAPFYCTGVWSGANHSYINITNEVSAFYEEVDGKPSIVRFAFHPAVDKGWR
jgi:hypothetical protein